MKAGSNTKSRPDLNKSNQSLQSVNVSRINASIGIIKLKNVLGLDEDER